MNYLIPKGLGRVPEWDQIVKIAAASGKSIDWLLTGVEPKTTAAPVIPEQANNHSASSADQYLRVCSPLFASLSLNIKTMEQSITSLTKRLDAQRSDIDRIEAALQKYADTGDTLPLKIRSGTG